MDYELKVFKALSDKTRLEIVSFLLEGEQSAGNIVNSVEKTQSTVSLQLKKLVELGILKSEKSGKNVFYRISDHKICDILRILGNKQIRTIKLCCKRLRK